MYAPTRRARPESSNLKPETRGSTSATRLGGSAHWLAGFVTIVCVAALVAERFDAARLDRQQGHHWYHGCSMGPGASERIIWGRST